MTIDMTFEAREKIFRKEEREEGRAEGREEGKAEAYIEMYKEGLISEEIAVSHIGCTIENFRNYLAKNSKEIKK